MLNRTIIQCDVEIETNDILFNIELICIANILVNDELNLNRPFELNYESTFEPF